ncbi:Protein K12C11.1 [Aphelenchoides avenae]|nr:Protein K12C11.1 [Aphelenchus avenae]
MGSTASKPADSINAPNLPVVPPKLFAENRTRLVNELRKKAPKGSVVVLQGGVDQKRYNTDMEDLPFRQESYFFWTFGVRESACYGAIDVDSGKSFLFPPRLPADYVIWQGKIEPEDWFKKRYEVDDVHFNDEFTIRDTLKKLSPSKLLTLHAENTDSGNWLLPASFKGVEEFATDSELLYPTIAELRVFKTDLELDVLRYATKIASDAHKAVMRHVKPGMYEYQLESGYNSSVLHYGHEGAPNDKLINDGDMCMFDMGPEYNCYSSDVTCSFPANGKFTEKQKTIYNAVLDANRAVFAAAKPGVRWTDMHLLAEKVLLRHLKAAGVLTGDTDEMIQKRVGAVFLPCGLGHFLGLDCHDVGGYLGDATPRSTLPGLKYLRTTRTLQERMVITIEPGIYFIDTLLDEALHDPERAKYFNVDVLKEYRGSGGMRIEDNVVIWATGNECLNQVPRTVEEIEQFMAGH